MLLRQLRGALYGDGGAALTAVAAAGLEDCLLLAGDALLVAVIGGRSPRRGRPPCWCCSTVAGNHHCGPASYSSSVTRQDRATRGRSVSCGQVMVKVALTRSGRTD